MRRLVLVLALLTALPALAVAKPLVAIDPGHGGGDTGARGVLPPGTQTGMPERLDKDGQTVIYEKDVNLDVAQRLNAFLQARGYPTVMTRNTDQAGGDVPYTTVGADLQARVDIANRAGAGLFVSVHNNALATTTSGTETYYYYYASPASRALAEVLHRQMLGALGLPDRGVRSAGFYVLKNTTMPAVLLEGAFLTNPQEALVLADPNVRQRIAEAVGQGVVDYDRAGYLNIYGAQPVRLVPKYQVNVGSYRRLRDAKARYIQTRRKGFRTVLRSEYNAKLRKYRFVVVAGKFIYLGNAKDLRGQLQRRGFKPTIGAIPRASRPVKLR